MNRRIDDETPAKKARRKVCTINAKVEEDPEVASYSADMLLGYIRFNLDDAPSYG